MIRWGEQRVLVVAPHPDDEVIGCAGLISRVKEEGGSVYVQFVTVGDTPDRSPTGFSSAEARDAEIAKVADLLRYDDHDLALRGNGYHLRLDSLAQGELIDVLERRSRLSIRAVEPTVVLLPQPTSYNQDHRAVAQATLTALRPNGHHPQPDLVLVYEQIADQWNTGLTFTPNLFVGLGRRHMEAKLDAMRAYGTQIRDHPSTRSCEALSGMAMFRGAQCGMSFAEAYQCLRWRV